MKDNVEILDVCCGGRMFYFDKNDPRVLFQDIRDTEATLYDGRTFSVKPDVVGDFRSMSFPDGRFSLVVFDPPHLREREKEKAGWQMIQYGWLDKDWKVTLSEGFKECFRVLKDGGFLIFKWNETDIPLSKILPLTNHKPVFGHKCGKKQTTHWLLFVK